MKKYNYISTSLEYLMSIVKVRLSLLCIVLILFFANQIEVTARDKFIGETEVFNIVYDQVPVLVIVEGYPNFYVDAIYVNNDLLYINVSALFQTLNIPCNQGQNGDVISGFIENESNTYSIDYNQKQIKIGEKAIKVNNGLVKEMGALYLEASLFAEAFGITLTFNYRALTVILKSNFELPVMRQQRLNRIRNNIAILKGEEITDTIVQRDYHLFKFGMVDWSVASYQTWKGTVDNHYGLGVGAEILHGEADVSINYYDRYKFDNRQLFYLWRWVDNDKKIIKQAQIGRISNQTISFINAPLVGAAIRNSPTTVRKATGYYTISEYTEPNWTIELYINNVLVDYTKADASGLYVFKVPNVYGYTTLKLKLYGPLGEERTEERTLNVPYTVMPAREFEYSLSAGVLQDSSLSRFGRGEFNYGINHIITVGGGLEYLSSIPNGAYIPFAKTTIQPYNKLTLTGEYAHGVRTSGLLDYYFWKDALLEIDYTKYVEGQLATRFNALEERKMKLSLPFRAKKVVGFSRFDYAQYVYKGFVFNQSSVMLSVYYKQFSASSSAQSNWIEGNKAYITSILSLSYRLGKGFTFRSSSQYVVSESRLMSYKAAIEKGIPRGYFTVAYERNLLFDDNFISLNFRYDLTFARTNISLSHSKGHIYTSESAQGSLAFGSGNNYLHASNNPSVGKGGISLYPFLDLNQNGIFDAGEHMIKLTSVKVMGSKAIFSEKDSIVRIPDLYAFTNCVVEFKDNDLENIAWRFKNKTYQVLIDPNQFKRIDVPIITVGEVSGMSYMNKDNILTGLGRILVKFYNTDNQELVAETLSETDGYISYMGLEPGKYIARIDSAQLSNLNFTVDPPQIKFTIKALEEGDVVENIDFVFKDKKYKELLKSDTARLISVKKLVSITDTIQYSNKDSLNPALQHHVVKDSIASYINELPIDRNANYTPVWGIICTQIGNYCIQCGAFRYKSNAIRFALYIKKNSDRPVGIVFQEGLYKVRVECVTTKKEAIVIKTKLIDKIVCDDMFVLKRK